jgi:hypothetical protein
METVFEAAALKKQKMDQEPSQTQNLVPAKD